MYQIEQITIYGPRLPSGLWKSGDGPGDPPVGIIANEWSVPQISLSFYGNFHTGTADADQSLMEVVQTCNLGSFQTGRQNITRNAVIVLYVLLECLKWISSLLSLAL